MRIPRQLQSRQISGIVKTLWIVNALGLVGLLVFLLFFNVNPHNHPALAAEFLASPTHVQSTSTKLGSSPTTIAITPTSTSTQIKTLQQLSSPPLQTATFLPPTRDPKVTISATKKITYTPTPSVTPSPYPTPVPGRVTIIGTSVAGRPLEMYKYGNGPVGRLIIAGIHGGNEWNTVKLAYELIDTIEKKPNLIPKNVTLFILPNLNPDGYARGKGVDGRVNDNGVDLNRNWPYLWQADWPRGSCWHYTDVTSGAYPASEPEIFALITFINEHPEISALISYHSAALGVFAGGVPEFKPSTRLAEDLAKAGGYKYPPEDIGCLYTGNLTDWVSSTKKIAAVDIELRNHRYTDFFENMEVLKIFLKWR
jgi:hypothetical protein